MSYYWKTHNGKEIFVPDYSGMSTSNEMINLLREACEAMKQRPQKVLMLANFENVCISTAFMQEAQRLGKEVITPRTEKMALIGVKNMQEIFVRAYILFTGQKNMRIFKNEKDALDWLAS